MNANTGRTVRPLAHAGPYYTTTPEEAEAAQRKMTAGRPWTAKQRAELRRYTGDDFKGINGVLRTGKGSARDRAAVEEIRGAMRELPDGFALNRTVTAVAFGLRERGARGLTPAEGAALVGRTWHDPGFTSTTVNERKSTAIQLRISVPPGTRAAYLESMTKNKGETEMLLDAGTHFKITAVKNNLYGETIIDVMVVGQDD